MMNLRISKGKPNLIDPELKQDLNSSIRGIILTDYILKILIPHSNNLAFEKMIWQIGIRKAANNGDKWVIATLQNFIKRVIDIHLKILGWLLLIIELFLNKIMQLI